MSILYDFSNNLKIEKMSFPWTDKSVTGLKAGTPVDESGAVSNDGNAIGLVAEDIPHPGYSMYSVVEGEGDSLSAPISVITAGYVDLAAAEKASGLTLTDACKSALTGIVFVEGGVLETLPAPATEGDVLAVGKVADPSVVILPEQTVEIEEGETYYLPTGGDPTLFVEGAKVCVTVNNESLIDTVVDDDGDINVSFDHGCALVYAEDKWWFYDSDSYYGGDPITISVTGTKNAWTERTNDADVIIRVEMEEGEHTGTIVVEKSDPFIAQKFAANPSSVRPFVYYHETTDDGSIYPCVSVFEIRNGMMAIRSYTMFVQSTPNSVSSDYFIFVDGVWEMD